MRRFLSGKYNSKTRSIMPVHYMKNPMYALCLLAAVCVRQHVQQNGVVQPLTKGVTLQTPTSVITKPNEASLKTVINANKQADGERQDKQKHIKIEEADSLVNCVENFAKRARRIVEEFRTGIPTPKPQDHGDPLASSNILDSLLYLTSSVGIKWLA